jgi:serine/threonine protein kinase
MKNIDVSNLSIQDRDLLRVLFAAEPARSFFDTQPISLKRQNKQELIMKLSAPILRLNKAKTKDSYAILIPLSQGSRAHLWQSTMSMDDCITTYKEPSKVVKIYNLPFLPTVQDKALTEDINQEYACAKNISALQAEAPIHEVNRVRFSHKVFAISNYLEGEELFELVKKDMHSTEALTGRERLELSIAILCAYRDQMVANGWYHGDIKPENIIVRQKDGQFTVHFIDFGNASPISANKARHRGTPGYYSRELLDLKRACLSRESEIFSLGRVLMLLMRPQGNFLCKEQVLLLEKQLTSSRLSATSSKDPITQSFLDTRSLAEDDPGKMQANWKILLSYKRPMTLELFWGINDYSQAEQQTINQLIGAMLSHDPITRPKLSDVISRYQALAKSVEAQEVKEKQTASFKLRPESPALGSGTLFCVPTLQPAGETEETVHHNTCFPFLSGF